MRYSVILQVVTTLMRLRTAVEVLFQHQICQGRVGSRKDENRNELTGEQARDRPERQPPAPILTVRR